MKRTVGVICFFLTAICAFLAGVSASQSPGRGILEPFRNMSTGMFKSMILAIAFFVVGMLCFISERRLPEKAEKLAALYRKEAGCKPNRAWEWALIINGLLLAAFFAAFFYASVNGEDSTQTGALLLALVVQLAVSMVLIVAFIFKSGKSIRLFALGLVLFMVEAVFIVLVFVFGKSPA